MYCIRDGRTGRWDGRLRLESVALTSVSAFSGSVLEMMMMMMLMTEETDYRRYVEVSVISVASVSLFAARWGQQYFRSRES